MECNINKLCSINSPQKAYFDNAKKTKKKPSNLKFSKSSDDDQITSICKIDDNHLITCC